MPIMWTEDIDRAFRLAEEDPWGFESAYYGSYFQLLAHLFPPNLHFDVKPQHQHNGDLGAVDFVVTFYLKAADMEIPALLVEVKHPDTFSDDSARVKADDQIRQRFRVYERDLLLPMLTGISVFGTPACFYRSTARDDLIPPAIPPHPDYFTNTAPEDQWNIDLVEAEGVTELTEVADDIKEMCYELRLD